METCINGTRHVLAVKNLEASVAYYKDKLGFESDWEDKGHWHQLHRDGFVVMLGECADDRSAFETHNHSYFAYADVQNVDEFYDEFVKRGADVLTKPEDKPWGLREFALRTVDGHRITFGQMII